MNAVITAKQIITSMEELLEQRHHLVVTRRVFMARWGKLRAQLNVTPEYLRFKHAVVTRSGGWCEQAGCESTGSVVHHRTKVAWCPALALSVKNGMHLCFKHHQMEHPKMRLAS